MIFTVLLRYSSSSNASIPAICAKQFTFQGGLILFRSWMTSLFPIPYPTLKPARLYIFVNDFITKRLAYSSTYSIIENCLLGLTKSIKSSSKKTIISLFNAYFTIFNASSILIRVLVGLLGLHKKIILAVDGIFLRN